MTGKITTKDGALGATIRKGIQQTEDWNSWIEANYSVLKLVFQKKLKSGESLPNEFAQLDKSRIHYAVIAGRRCDYKSKTYETRRRLFKERDILLLHYDNLIDASKLLIKDGRY